jgi:putative salt-induced outer membrane protein
VRLATLCLLCVSALLSADQVVLNNGDTISGNIIKKDGDKLTLKSDFLGEVSMPWSAVRSLRSDADLTVVLPGGEAIQGKLNTSGNDLQVSAATGPRTAPLAGVGAIRNTAEQRTYERLQHPGLLELWTGYFDLGLSLARGNAHTDTLTTAFNASRITRTSKLTTYFNEIFASARINGVNDSTASAIRGGWSYNHNISPRAFLSALNEYEHDRFQNLDLRFVLGGGPGYNAIRRDRTRLDVLAGADYERENFMSQIHRNSAEANFGDELLYRLSGVTTINQSSRFFSNLSEGGEYRVNFDLGAVTTLKKWLGWQLTASDRFLSNPVFGKQRNDVLLSTGFRVSFAK